MKQKILPIIQSTSHVAITHDGWTSLATQSFNTTTCHFIDPNWTLKTVVLETSKVQGRHTSENIADSLKQVKT